MYLIIIMCFKLCCQPHKIWHAFERLICLCSLLSLPTPVSPQSLILCTISFSTIIIFNVVIVIIQHQGDWTGAVCFDHCSLLLCHPSTQAQTGEDFKANIECQIQNTKNIVQKIHLPKYQTLYPNFVEFHQILGNM